MDFRFFTIITTMLSNLDFLIKWYLLVLILGWIVLPITFQLFKTISDRGYSVSKILGLLLAGFFHWFLNSLGLSMNSGGGIWAIILFLCVMSIWFIHKIGFSQLSIWIKNNLRFIFVSEMIFLVAFLGMAWLRSYNPDILGTEKPMELMFINSIMRSPTFPPQDAWLAGYSISYYYFGYVLAAMLAMVTATPASIAFNLTISLLFALSFLGAFGVILNLIAQFSSDKAKPVQLTSFIPMSLVAPVVLLMVGNLYGILDVLHNHHALANLNVPAIWFQTGIVDSGSQTAIAPRVEVGSINFWEWMDIKQLGPVSPQPVPFRGLDQPNWFFASRTIHDRNLMGYDPEAIDEFPAFSFLLADLHPHVLALPFVLMVILLCFEWLMDLRKQKEEEEVRSIPWERSGLSAIILGSLIFLNTWDFPFYVFLFVLSGAIAYFFQQDEWTLKDLLSYLKPFGWVILFSVLLYVPFLVTFQSQAGGIIPNAIYPTKLRQLLVMFGPLLLGFIGLTVVVLRKYRAVVDFKTGWKVTLGFFGTMVAITILLTGAMFLKPEMVTVLNDTLSVLTVNQALRLLLLRRLVEGGTLLLGLLLLAGCIAIIWGLRKTGSETLLFVFAMGLTGTLLLLGPEFVYLRDNFGWRMNTLFKFYFQIWILWSLVASFGFWYLLRQTNGWKRSLAVFVVALGFLAGLVYSVGTVQETTRGMRDSVRTLGVSQPTLDGLAFYSIYHPEDWAMIQWINENVDSQAVVLEGTKGAYWVEGRSSRVAMITGLQTVMGWVNHEGQWRGEDFVEVAGREGDIHRIYTERDWGITEQLLDRYQVDYVVLSPLEREWYGSIPQSKFDENMQRVFEYSDYVVYQR